MSSIYDPRAYFDENTSPKLPEEDFPEAEQENADANVAINRKVFAIEVAVGMKHLFKDKDEFFAFVEELETRLT
jgi:hypothetical protein